MTTWRVDDIPVHKLVDHVDSYNKIRNFLPGFDTRKLTENLEWLVEHGFNPAAHASH